MANEPQSINRARWQAQTRDLSGFDFKAPARAGDIVRLLSVVESTGTTSCRIAVWAVNARTNVEVFRTFAVMVNVKLGRKTPLPAPADN